MLISLGSPQNITFWQLLSKNINISLRKSIYVTSECPRTQLVMHECVCICYECVGSAVTTMDLIIVCLWHYFCSWHIVKRLVLMCVCVCDRNHQPGHRPILMVKLNLTTLCTQSRSSSPAQHRHIRGQEVRGCV